MVVTRLCSMPLSHLVICSAFAGHTPADHESGAQDLDQQRRARAIAQWQRHHLGQRELTRRFLSVGRIGEEREPLEGVVVAEHDVPV